jgi:uncharacterized protein YaiI (UPF0178 family)
MKILVDGDACPKSVLHICKKVGRKYGVPVWSVASFHHNIESDHHVVVGDASQEADIKIMNMTDEGDVVVTGDQGLAAIVLGKGAKSLSPAGREFRSDRIEFMLEERAIKSRVRRAGGRTKGPKRRTGEDDRRFEICLEQSLKGLKKMGDTSDNRPRGAGRSSFDLIDPGKFFCQIGLKKGNTFLDMACGRGDYAIAASKIVGAEGLVYAVDLWEEGIAALRDRASAEAINNLKAIIADVGEGIPIENGTVDICLMATVLHDLVQTRDAQGAVREAARVLNPLGSLAVIEFKKIERPPGPPVHIRLAPDEVESLVAPYGFRKGRFLDVGPYNYMMTFGRPPDSE